MPLSKPLAGPAEPSRVWPAVEPLPIQVWSGVCPAGMYAANLSCIVQPVTNVFPKLRYCAALRAGELKSPFCTSFAAEAPPASAAVKAASVAAATPTRKECLSINFPLTLWRTLPHDEA